MTLSRVIDKMVVDEGRALQHSLVELTEHEDSAANIMVHSTAAFIIHSVYR